MGSFGNKIATKEEFGGEIIGANKNNDAVDCGVIIAVQDYYKNVPR